jgi:hypothetical protein
MSAFAPKAVVRRHWLAYFGTERHDNLVDALVWLILGLVEDAIEEQKVHYVQ